MSDPLADAGSDRPSPFVTSLNTINTSLDILRHARDHYRGPEGAAGAGLAQLTPVRVWIRNDTGTDLTVGSIVAIGDPLITITDTDAVHAFRDEPVFKGTTPAATTDAFAILIEPIAATTGSGSATEYSYGRALVLGVTVCEVNMVATWPTHSYATPMASTTARLTSGMTGPVRILYAATGTGNKTAAVLIGSGKNDPDVNAATLSTSGTSITPDNTWVDIDNQTHTFSPGTYLLMPTFAVQGAISATAPGIISLRIWNDTDGVAVDNMTVTGLRINSTGVTEHRITTLIRQWTTVVDNTLKLQALRNTGPTWTAAQVLTNTAGTIFNFMRTNPYPGI